MEYITLPSYNKMEYITLPKYNKMEYITLTSYNKMEYITLPSYNRRQTISALSVSSVKLLWTTWPSANISAADKEIFSFHETCGFITAITTAYHLSVTNTVQTSSNFYKPVLNYPPIKNQMSVRSFKTKFYSFMCLCLFNEALYTPERWMMTVEWL